MKAWLAAGAIMAMAASSAGAAVIAGPTLTAPGETWVVTGLEFQAQDNSHLTSFTFQNQGQADTVDLTDAAGDILDSVVIPSGDPSDTVSVNWALASGQSYWLLQTTQSNELFQAFGSTLPSDADIAITFSGGFGDSISDTVTNGEGWGSNEYWAAFNNITTTTSGVPEPGAWALTIMGAGLLGAAARRRRAIAA
jgi:hypothetical protein